MLQGRRSCTLMFTVIKKSNFRKPSKRQRNCEVTAVGWFNIKCRETAASCYSKQLDLFYIRGKSVMLNTEDQQNNEYINACVQFLQPNGKMCHIMFRLHVYELRITSGLKLRLNICKCDTTRLFTENSKQLPRQTNIFDWKSEHPQACLWPPEQTKTWCLLNLNKVFFYAFTSPYKCHR